VAITAMVAFFNMGSALTAPNSSRSDAKSDGCAESLLIAQHVALGAPGNRRSQNMSKIR
jgi:hypothetical protein